MKLVIDLIHIHIDLSEASLMICILEIALDTRMCDV